MHRLKKYNFFFAAQSCSHSNSVRLLLSTYVTQNVLTKIFNSKSSVGKVWLPGRLSLASIDALPDPQSHRYSLLARSAIRWMPTGECPRIHLKEQVIHESFGPPSVEARLRTESNPIQPVTFVQLIRFLHLTRLHTYFGSTNYPLTPIVTHWLYVFKLSNPLVRDQLVLEDEDGSLSSFSKLLESTYGFS